MSAISVSLPFSPGVRLRTRKASQSGRKSGYFSTSATRSNICPGVCRTRRVVRNEGMPIFRRGPRSGAEPRQARRLEPREILPRMMRGARQGARRDEPEALGVGDRLEALELVGGDEADHRVVLARGSEILADGQEIDLGR